MYNYWNPRISFDIFRKFSYNPCMYSSNISSYAIPNYFFVDEHVPPPQCVDPSFMNNVGYNGFVFVDNSYAPYDPRSTCSSSSSTSAYVYRMTQDLISLLSEQMEMMKDVEEMNIGL